MFEELGMNDTYCYELGNPNSGLIDGHHLKENKINVVEFDKIGHTQ